VTLRFVGLNLASRVPEEAHPVKKRMLRIERSEDESGVVFVVSGRLTGAYVAELERVAAAEGGGRPLTLDLEDMTHVAREGVALLARLERGGARLQPCPEYVRRWISSER
jgi:hypothetical protein